MWSVVSRREKRSDIFMQSNITSRLIFCLFVRVVRANTSPVFEEPLRLSSVGRGAVLVLNVMSKYSFGGDSIIGQVIRRAFHFCNANILLSQCIFDIDKRKELLSGKKHFYRLPLTKPTHLVCDSSGRQIEVGDGHPQGSDFG